jgi:ankyrin repeat protein
MSCVFAATINASMIKLYMSRDTSLYDAAKRGDENEVQRLLQAGIDANQEDDGEPALIAAAQQGDLGIVRLLVERGARVDATDDYLYEFLIFPFLRFTYGS